MNGGATEGDVCFSFKSKHLIICVFSIFFYISVRMRGGGLSFGFIVTSNNFSVMISVQILVVTGVQFAHLLNAAWLRYDTQDTL